MWFHTIENPMANWEAFIRFRMQYLSVYDLLLLVVGIIWISQNIIVIVLVASSITIRPLHLAACFLIVKDLYLIYQNTPKILWTMRKKEYAFKLKVYSIQLAGFVIRSLKYYNDTNLLHNWNWCMCCICIKIFSIKGVCNKSE